MVGQLVTLLGALPLIPIVAQYNRHTVDVDAKVENDTEGVHEDFEGPLAHRANLRPEALEAAEYVNSQVTNQVCLDLPRKVVTVAVAVRVDLHLTELL